MATFTIRKGREGQMAGVDPRLMAIIREAAANAPPGVSRVEAFSGKAGRSTGTKNHPGGRAVDYTLYDANGREIENFVGRNISKAEYPAYQINEQFAQTARAVQQKIYPELNDRLRWGGYFMTGTPGDLMHLDLSGGLSSKTPPQTTAWQSGIPRGPSIGQAALTQPVNVAAAPQDGSAIASLLPPQGGTLAQGVRAGAEAYAPFLPPPVAQSPGQAAISDLISPPSTTSDRDKLAGVMLAEARGEGREGMIGVGNVVLNRQNAGGERFPKTIDGVINSEFAKPLGPNNVSPDEWVEATQAATQLLDGTIPDNTGGAVYFANTATSNPSAYAQIANSGPVSATIGNHTFHTDAKIGAVARGTGDLSADQIDELTRTDVAGNYTNPLITPPPGRPPGPGGALGVNLGQQPAGMPPPPSRAGNFDWLGGGAPPAAMVPPPGISPLRPAFGGPTAAPAIAPPLERANRNAGQGGPTIPITPDEMRASLANANVNTERTLGVGWRGNLGTPETQMSLERSFPPPPALAEARTKDESYALPGPVAGFDRGARAGQVMGLPPSLNVGAFPEPSFSGGGGADTLIAGNADSLLPPPDLAAQLGIHNIATAAPEADPALWAAGMDQYRPMMAVPSIDRLPGVTVWKGGVPPTEPTSIKSAAQVAAEESVQADPAAAVAPAAVVAEPPQDSQARSRRAGGGARSNLGPLGRILTAPLAPFIGGRNGGGMLGFGGFGGPPNFTAYANPVMNTGMGGTIRTSGKTPSGTPWSTGTSNNALGGSNALRWTGSGGQTITAYTDPTTGQTFHSFS